MGKETIPLYPFVEPDSRRTASYNSFREGDNNATVQRPSEYHDVNTFQDVMPDYEADRGVKVFFEEPNTLDGNRRVYGMPGDVFDSAGVRALEEAREQFDQNRAKKREGLVDDTLRTIPAEHSTHDFDEHNADIRPISKALGHPRYRSDKEDVVVTLRNIPTPSTDEADFNNVNGPNSRKMFSGERPNHLRDKDLLDRARLEIRINKFLSTFGESQLMLYIFGSKYELENYINTLPKGSESRYLDHLENAINLLEKIQSKNNFIEYDGRSRSKLRMKLSGGDFNLVWGDGDLAPVLRPDDKGFLEFIGHDIFVDGENLFGQTPEARKIIVANNASKRHDS